MLLTVPQESERQISGQPIQRLVYDQGMTAARSSTMHLSLLSTFAMFVDGSPVEVAPNVKRVVALLALRARPELRLTVASRLWMDTTEERANANLRTALWKARQTLDGCIQVLGNNISLAPFVDVDVNHVLERTHRLLDDDEPLGRDEEPGDLLYDLLPDWDEEWIAFERERLRQMRIHALEALCRKLVCSDRFGEAIDAGLAAVAAEPLRESAQRVLISAHITEGNLCEARRQYVTYREMLWDELGVEPSEALRGLIGLGATTR